MNFIKELLSDRDKVSHNLKMIFWGIGGLLLLVGFYGWAIRFFNGHIKANYGSIVTWGLWVAAYIYFIGLSAGSFLVSSMVYVFNFKKFERIGKLAVFTALVTLLMALLSIWVDLGHMGRAWHVMVFPNFKSPMAWMIYLYSIYMLLLFVEIYFLLRYDFVTGSNNETLKGKLYKLFSLGSTDKSEESKLRDKKIVKRLATAGVPIAILFHGGVGALFGVVAARPHWHSGLFPILFLLSALVSGGALLTLISSIFQEGWSKNKEIVIELGKMVLALLLLDILFQVSEFLVAYRGGIPGHTAGFDLVISGPYAWVFWGWQGFIGTIVPIVILVLPTRKSPRWVALAGFLIAAGIFGLRLNIVIPGLAVEEIHGLTSAIYSHRVDPHYFPSISEWLLTFGIVGFGMLLFGLGEHFLPTHNESETESLSESKV
ncbi:MAG: NrfD/PsrC family molybdoenzyme membrane anchor subunit [Stygiobacter sp.]|uniref:Polysulfide reductase NrfD n=1 Tax=Stygiobacter electus TaxID=3032292 RepID=A0AAE3P3Q1_9BACT|nr:NrfD/PsrC family molybdoenzyme membrane anchor subunit [Stygiobacter electus]MDF1613267.1 polysulfide reductase NrfD [Stygiobacter electus]